MDFQVIYLDFRTSYKEFEKTSKSVPLFGIFVCGFAGKSPAIPRPIQRYKHIENQFLIKMSLSLYGQIPGKLHAFLDFKHSGTQKKSRFEV